ncbi:hypothetical protein IGS75_01330 [Gluconobacter sphaericus]|uniref:hypothetical protein n=1 Tax=Gluconobacter sphaericus TaxID=574987 RepID=UPI0019212D20|nr:hypothetical protein [Gluconobacter sphaericus]QQX91312.1 hypothetical protein IGS75_01330 [Gluconobacter sphaericus]
MGDERAILCRVFCPAPVVNAEVKLATDTWTHIQGGHPETNLDDLVHTLQFPQAVHRDAKKPNSVLIVGERSLPGSESLMRVSVKAGLADGPFVQTAHYARDQIKTKQIWPTDEEGQDE